MCYITIFHLKQIHIKMAYICTPPKNHIVYGKSMRSGRSCLGTKDYGQSENLFSCKNFELFIYFTSELAQRSF